MKVYFCICYCLLVILLAAGVAHGESDADMKRGYEQKIAEQEKKHEEIRRELQEETVKHERTQRSAAEIEDSLRAELKRLKEEKPTDYIKVASETASQTAQELAEAAQEQFQTLKEKSGEAWEATSEFHKSTIKPAVDDLVKQAVDFVEPHAAKIAPTVEPIAKEAKKSLNRWYTKLSIMYETYRLRLINALAAQPNMTNAGAEYVVDLAAGTVLVTVIYYLVFPFVAWVFSILTCGLCGGSVKRQPRNRKRGRRR